MATIEQYQNGKAARAVRSAWQAMQAIKGNLAADDIGKRIIASVGPLAPAKMKMDQAAKLISDSRACAVGQRVCCSEFPNSPSTESVFLDELAEGLVKVGKAKFVGKDQAVEALAKSKGKPIVATKVEGKYMEICRTWHENCVYWNLEKRGQKCLSKYKQGG